MFKELLEDIIDPNLFGPIGGEDKDKLIASVAEKIKAKNIAVFEKHKPIWVKCFSKALAVILEEVILPKIKESYIEEANQMAEFEVNAGSQSEGDLYAFGDNSFRSGRDYFWPGHMEILREHIKPEDMMEILDLASENMSHDYNISGIK